MTAEQHAIVTGGSSGIGAETCRALLAQGHRVTCVARRPLELQSPRLRSVTLDLTDAQASWEALRSLAAEDPATLLVHCAGAIRQRPLEAATRQDLEDLTRLHVGCAIALVQANLAAMKAAHSGRIVLVSSRAALGLANRTVYSATKAALVGLVRTWTLELGPCGITANVVAPGPIADTEMFDAHVPADSRLRQQPGGSIPVGRLGVPADVARAILFFLAPEAGFVSGQVLYVCGGTSVGGLVL
jgi:NAD(P)-dependent dehydrogenase (short-subunit alcohol dehydrogenase family)